MATIVLAYAGGAVGGYFGGPGGAAAGYAIGAAAGAYIDGKYIMPMFLPRTPDVYGPRLDSIPIQQASEGSAVAIVRGPSNRIAGTVIWCSPLRETQNSQGGGGGKGGGGGQSAPAQIYYTYSCDVAVAICGDPILAVDKIWGDSYVISQTEDDGLCDDITVYDGTQTTPNSLMVSYEGQSGQLSVGDTPSYNGTAYVVFHNLRLAQFGNRIPNITFQVRERMACGVGDIIGDYLGKAGVTLEQYDVSRVHHCVYGHVTNGPVSPAGVIQQLMQAFDIVCQETNGVLKFFHRGDEDYVVVSDGDTGAGQGRPDPIRTVSVADKSNYDLPATATVNYIDPVLDMQKGSAIETKMDAPGNVAVVAELPLTLQAVDARKIAARALWRPWAERQEISLTLPPSYLKVQEHDNLQVAADGYTYLVHVLQVDRGANFVHKVKGVVMQVAVNNLVNDNFQSVPPSPGTSTVVLGEELVPATYTFRAWDSAALTEDQCTKLGFYWSAARALATDAWTGAYLYSSSDGVNWTLENVLNTESVCGVASNTLGAGTTDAWDRLNTVDVVVDGGRTLSSATEDLVMNGEANVCMIGTEILAYTTATLLSAGTYRLSNLLRGLRNTEAEVGTHAAGDVFTSLSDAGVGFKEITLGQRGVSRTYKVCAPGVNPQLGGSTTQVYAPTAKTVQPFSPAYIAGTRDGSNNLTVTWKVRSRSLLRSLTESAFPLYETSMRFEVDIMSGSTVLRTISTTSETCTYSAANQTTDGITPGNPVTLRVYQLSDTIGRGNVASATV